MNYKLVSVGILHHCHVTTGRFKRLSGEWYALISELIAQIVNASVPGAARFIEVPEMGHGGQHYLSMADAFAGKQAPFDPKIIRTMTDWLDQQRKKPEG